MIKKYYHRGGDKTRVDKSKSSDNKPPSLSTFG